MQSYVRGKTGEEGNEYLRQGAVISYIAIEFYEQEKNRSFVIGLKIESHDLESNLKRNGSVRKVQWNSFPLSWTKACKR